MDERTAVTRAQTRTLPRSDPVHALLRATVAERWYAPVPATDPWSRVEGAVRVERRRRRTARLASGALLAVTVGAAGAGGLLASPRPQPDPPPRLDVGVDLPVDRWPTRGPLAADRPYLAAAAAQVRAHGAAAVRILYAGDLPAADSHVGYVHAGDVGGERLVLVLAGPCGPAAWCSDRRLEGWTSPAGAPASSLRRGAVARLGAAHVVAWVRADPNGPSPWVVLNPATAAPDVTRPGGVPPQIELSPSPQYDPAGRPSRQWVFWSGGGAVAHGRLGMLAADAARVRVTSVGGTLYDGPVQLTDTSRLDPARHRLTADERAPFVRAAAASQGELPADPAEVLRLTRIDADAHGARLADAEIQRVWSGRTSATSSALLVVVRTPDGATAVSVTERVDQDGTQASDDVVSGRLVGSRGRDRPVLWRSRVLPGRLVLVAAGATSATYGGPRPVPIPLTPYGAGIVRPGRPSGTALQSQVVTVYGRHQVLDEIEVPPSNAVDDPLDLSPP